MKRGRRERRESRCKHDRVSVRNRTNRKVFLRPFGGLRVGSWSGILGTVAATARRTQDELISSFRQESEPLGDPSLDCVAPSILPPVLAAVGPGGVYHVVLVLNLVLRVFLRLLLLLLVLLLVLLVLLLFSSFFSSASCFFSSRLSCAKAMSGTLSIPNPARNARRLKVLCTTPPYAPVNHRERQD